MGNRVDTAKELTHRNQCISFCRGGRTAMRIKNRRIVIVGSVLFVIAIAFFFFMLSIASKSNDPVDLMQTVGMVSGVVGGLSLTMIIIGLIGKKT